MNWTDLLGIISGLITIAAPINGAIRSNRVRLIVTYIIFVSIATTSLSLLLRWSGLLQKAELFAYDSMLKYQTSQPFDPKFLIIAITDEDIESDTNIEERNVEGQPEPITPSISDERLNLVLQKLESEEYKPLAVGLDIYRPYPISDNVPELEERFKQDNLFAICKKGYKQSSEKLDKSIAAPSEIVEQNEYRVGFSNLWGDPSDHNDDNPFDDPVRRTHLYTTPGTNIGDDICKAELSLSLLLASYYFYKNDENVKLDVGDNEELQLFVKDSVTNLQDIGKTKKQPEPNFISVFSFHSLKPYRSGPYGVRNSHIDVSSSGYQIPFTYRTNQGSIRDFAKIISVQEFLNGNNIPDDINQKIVLIGVVDAQVDQIDQSGQDIWQTPYKTKIPGVILHAQVTSYIIDAALKERTSIIVLHLGVDILCISVASFLGGILVSFYHKRIVQILLGINFLYFFTFLCIYILLTYGWWIPFIPALISIILSMSLSPIIIGKFLPSSSEE